MSYDMGRDELIERCRRAERAVIAHGDAQARRLVLEYISTAWEFWDLGNDDAAEMFSREALRAAKCPETAVA